MRPKNFIYYSLPGYGHINPTLNVARELVKKGHKVIYYASKEFKDYIEDAGVIFRDYEYEQNMDGTITRDLGEFIKVLSETTWKKLPKFLSVAKKDNPDCILHDSLAVWGKIIAQNIDVPAVCFVTTSAYNKRTFLTFLRLYPKVLKNTLKTGYDFLYAYGTYRLLAQKYGAKLNGPGDMMICKEKLNIVFSITSFQPRAKTFSKSFKFVGPSIYPRPEKDYFPKNIIKNKKIIYVSHGTLLDDNVSFFRTCINALKNTDFFVIVSLGDKIKLSDLPKIPKNFIVKKYVNQLSVLQKTSLFITHAGMNSVSESLYYGVPMILVPDTDEQTFNALNVQKFGAGILLSKNKLTEKLLLTLVNDMMNSSEYLTKAKEMQKEFRKAGGYKEAAQNILSYLDRS